MHEELERIAAAVIDEAMWIHKRFGPGLLESVYSALLQRRLRSRGFQVERENPMPVEMDGVWFNLGFRADLVINGCFIVEVKSVERLAPVHSKQLLTYLRVSSLRLGLLLNFGEYLLKNGIRRVAN